MTHCNFWCLVQMTPCKTAFTHIHTPMFPTRVSKWPSILKPSIIPAFNFASIYRKEPHVYCFERWHWLYSMCLVWYFGKHFVWTWIFSPDFNKRFFMVNINNVHFVVVSDVQRSDPSHRGNSLSLWCCQGTSWGEDSKWFLEAVFLSRIFSFCCNIWWLKELPQNCYCQSL